MLNSRSLSGGVLLIAISRDAWGTVSGATNHTLSGRYFSLSIRGIPDAGKAHQFPPLGDVDHGTRRYREAPAHFTRLKFNL